MKVLHSKRCPVVAYWIHEFYEIGFMDFMKRKKKKKDLQRVA